MGIDVVIRNEAGLVMAAMSQKIQMVQEAGDVEALAASYAFSFEKVFGFRNMALEGDSLRQSKHYGLGSKTSPKLDTYLRMQES